MVGSIQCSSKYFICPSTLLIAASISETAVYSPGMGLGASKGRDIGKYTDGFSSYVHMAQDSVMSLHFIFIGKAEGHTQARERYGS